MVFIKESAPTSIEQPSAENLSTKEVSKEVAAEVSIDDLPDNLPDDFVLPPTDLDSDEPALESDLHLRQILLLLTSLEWLWQDREDFFASGNLTIYFSPKQLKSRDFRGPDFFVVLDTERRTRKSWVVWEEGGKYPNVLVEILSRSTANVDRTTKKELYQNVFRTPEYFWFDPVSLEFAGFSLSAGKYDPITPNQQGWLWSRQLDLFLGIHNEQLRYFTAEGNLVSSPQEAATAEQEKAQAAQEKAQAAQEKAERLAQQLRELGVDPDD
ncbi:MAG: Uma2 family endonuclease [Cyanobacteria bacterium J06621_3]